MISHLLKNGTCAALCPPTLDRVDLRIVDGVIVERGRDLQPMEGDQVEDLAGKILMPGLVCAHTHLYSSLARGMPGPDTPPLSFLGILEKIWWKLDRALDADTIYFSALAGALEAVRCGVTTIVDHHSSPNAIDGSLLLVKKALAEVGLRGILCYEVSDRNGIKPRDKGLAENEEFIKTHLSDQMYRGLVGAHASFTLSDESLRSIGDIAERYDTGVHIHVAESDTDPWVTETKYGRSILDRLGAFGILRRKSLFAHCIHLSPSEFSRLRLSGTWLIHNPRSNMNNRVGHAPLGEFGARAALGTDGFLPDMFEEVRMAYFRNREGENGQDCLQLLDNGQLLVSEAFGRPFGALREDAPADLVVMDYQAPTPMTTGNFYSHVIFGFRSASIESVMVNGRWIFRNRRYVRLNEQEIASATSEAAQRLWSAMYAVKL
jgi:putative selenium metabolism protein SsnA